MEGNLVYMTTPEEYISSLENVANKDLFNPCQYPFDTVLQYLDQLIQTSKKCATDMKYEDAYIGFRRFQIVLTSLQKYRLYNPEDSRIKELNLRCQKIDAIVGIIRAKLEEKVNMAIACTYDVGYLPTGSYGREKLERPLSSTMSVSNPAQNTDSLSFKTRISESMPVSGSQGVKKEDESLFSSTQSDELQHIMSNLDLIPDVRDVRMHVGLPLPDNELNSLLMYDM